MESKKEESSKTALKSKIKKTGCFTLIFTVILSLLVSVLAFLWAGGWMKDATCSLVLEDSFVWEKANCDSMQKKEAEEENNNTVEINVPNDFNSQEDLITRVIEEVSPAVVTVAVNNLAFDQERGFTDKQEGIGSGFVVDSEGIIVTNQHVVSEENVGYSVVLPGEEEPVNVEKVYRDRTNDLALLKVEKKNLTALKLGGSNKLKRGNLVIAIGNPFGGLAGTATVGYVTGLGRDVTAGSGFFGSVARYEDVIQTDAAINPGNSGGPLLNSKGEVIGINFATTSGADNISFAIPVNRLKSRLELFQKEGRFPQPYIGISYSRRTVYLGDAIQTGAVVLSVEENGPADKAELKKGDFILSVDGESLEQASLASIIQSKEVGSELKLQYWRKGDVNEGKVKIGDKGLVEK